MFSAWADGFAHELHELARMFSACADGVCPRIVRIGTNFSLRWWGFAHELHEYFSLRWWGFAHEFHKFLRMFLLLYTELILNYTPIW